MVKKSDQLQKARDYAFLLLKFRLRSNREITERLKKKGFDEDTIREAVVFLNEKRFLDDELFARLWAESRAKKNLGARRIKEELKAKGIDKSLIEENLKKIKSDYPEEAIVREIIEERMKRLKNIEPVKAKSRLYAYLMRRGFSPDIVLENLNRLCMPIS